MGTTDAQLPVQLPSGLDTDANPLDAGAATTATTFQNFIPGTKNQLRVRYGLRNAGVLSPNAATVRSTPPVNYCYAIGCLQYGTRTITTYQYASGETSSTAYPFVPLPLVGDARASKIVQSAVPTAPASTAVGKTEFNALGATYRELVPYYYTPTVPPSTTPDSMKLLVPVYRDLVNSDVAAAPGSPNADYTPNWEPSSWTPFGNSVMIGGFAVCLSCTRGQLVSKSKGAWYFGGASKMSSLPLLWGGTPPSTATGSYGTSYSSDLRGTYTTVAPAAGSTSLTVSAPTATWETPVVGDLVTLAKDASDNYRNGVYRVVAVGTTSVVGANTQVALTVQNPLGSLSQDVANGSIQLSAWTQGSSTNACSVWRILALPNAPTDIGCLAVYQNRLFGGRGVVTSSSGTAIGQYFGYYNNVLQWSAVGNPLYWPDSNFALLDESLDDPITALAATDDFMLVFRRSSIFILTGYDEATFSLNQISSVNGVLDPRAVYATEGAVYWANARGVYRYQGGGIESLTGDGNASGVAALVTQALGRNDTHPLARVTSLRITNNNKLIVSTAGMGYESLGSTTPPDSTTLQNAWQGLDNASFVLDLPTGAWGTLKHAATNSCPTMLVGLFGRTLGITRFGFINMDDAFAPDTVTSQVTATNYADQSPTGATTGGINPQYVLANNVPQAACTIDVPIMSGKTMRVREIEVQSNAQRATTYSATLQSDWQIDIAADPNITSFTNWGGYGSAPRSTGPVSRHYLKTDVLRYSPTGGASAEGRRFVVRIRYTGLVSNQPDGLYLSTFAVTLRAEPTRDSRVPTQ